MTVLRRLEMRTEMSRCACVIFISETERNSVYITIHVSYRSEDVGEMLTEFGIQVYSSIHKQQLYSLNKIHVRKNAHLFLF